MLDVTHRLVAVVLLVVMEELRWVVEELTVAVNCSWEGLGEPIQSHAVQNVVERWSLIRPLNKFLTNPDSVVSVSTSQALHGYGYQASNPIGLLDKTRPIVAGRVPWKRA